jgi:pimeloyl-ACP methyl ester carboxylesterase
MSGPVISNAPLVCFAPDLAARVRSGPGERILWLHGYTLDSSSWSELWDLLPRWSHIGIDLPGHGASMPLDPSEDLPKLARRIGKIALDQDVRHIIALSFGTLLALQIVIEYPTSFRSLTLGAPALGGGPQDAEVGARYQELAGMYRQHGFSPDLRKRWMSSPPNIFKGAEAHPQLWDRLWQIVGRHPWWELTDGSYSRLSNHAQSRNDLAKVQTPALILIGDNELAPFKRCAELIRRYMPHCRRVYLPIVGHLCMLEDAASVHAILEQHCAESCYAGID